MAMRGRATSQARESYADAMIKYLFFIALYASRSERETLSQASNKPK